jgi:hypothetical protein
VWRIYSNPDPHGALAVKVLSRATLAATLAHPKNWFPRPTAGFEKTSLRLLIQYKYINSYSGNYKARARKLNFATSRVRCSHIVFILYNYYYNSVLYEGN